MNKLTFRIKTLSPVIFAMNVGDTNMVATREYIPGSVIMGFFAGKFIQKNNINDNVHENKTFFDWFLQGGVRFTNANIVTEDDRKAFKRYHPAPLSIQHEKGNENEIYDLLFTDEAFEGQTVGIEGFGSVEDNYFSRQPVSKSLNFHHQRDFAKGTTREIFNYESIEANQTFEGDILGDCATLNSFLGMFEKTYIGYIGRSRNAQYGKVKIDIISQAPEDFISEIDGVTIEDGEISLTLLSNTIIYNDNGYPATDIKVLEGILKEKLGNGVEIKKAFVRTDEVENFVSVWRLRKPSETCFKAGSCFLLTGIVKDKREKLIELQKNGIGERRGEGFGRIVFGWQKEEALKLKNIIRKKCKKPDGDIPQKTREIVQIIVKDFIRKRVELNALTDVKEFVREDLNNKGLPSKALIGRLEDMVKSLDKGRYRLAVEKDLRATARDKLEGCKSKKMTLLEHLQEKEIAIDDVFRHITNNSEIKGLWKNAGIEQEDVRKFEDEIYRTYFSSFFSEMRRILKKE